jgi:hypothetical protein
MPWRESHLSPKEDLLQLKQLGNRINGIPGGAGPLSSECAYLCSSGLPPNEPAGLRSSYVFFQTGEIYVACH